MKNKKYASHYDYLLQHWEAICKTFGVRANNGAISSCGDKCWSYMDALQKECPKEHIAALYLLTHFQPFYSEVKDKNGCSKVDMLQWLREHIYLTKGFPK